MQIQQVCNISACSISSFKFMTKTDWPTLKPRDVLTTYSCCYWWQCILFLLLRTII